MCVARCASATDEADLSIDVNSAAYTQHLWPLFRTYALFGEFSPNFVRQHVRAAVRAHEDASAAMAQIDAVVGALGLHAIDRAPVHALLDRVALASAVVDAVFQRARHLGTAREAQAIQQASAAVDALLLRAAQLRQTLQLPDYVYGQLVADALRELPPATADERDAAFSRAVLRSVEAEVARARERVESGTATRVDCALVVDPRGVAQYAKSMAHEARRRAGESAAAAAQRAFDELGDALAARRALDGQSASSPSYIAQRRPLDQIIKNRRRQLRQMGRVCVRMVSSVVNGTEAGAVAAGVGAFAGGRRTITFVGAVEADSGVMLFNRALSQAGVDPDSQVVAADDADHTTHDYHARWMLLRGRRTTAGCVIDPTDPADSTGSGSWTGSSSRSGITMPRRVRAGQAISLTRRSCPSLPPNLRRPRSGTARPANAHLPVAPRL